MKSSYPISGHCQCGSIQYEFAYNNNDDDNSTNKSVVFTDQDLITLHEKKKQQHKEGADSTSTTTSTTTTCKKLFLTVGQVCICHCGMCRHAMGCIAPIAMALPIQYLQFRTTSNRNDDGNNEEEEGKDDNGAIAAATATTTTKEYPKQLKSYNSSPNTIRYFCNTCGCSILFRYPNDEPNTIWVYVATLNEKLQRNSKVLRNDILHNPNVTSHICTSDQPIWYQGENNDASNADAISSLSSKDDCILPLPSSASKKTKLPSCKGLELWIPDSCK